MPTTLVSGSGLGFPQHLRTPCVVLSGLFAHFLYLADVCLLPNVLTLSHFGDGQKCIMLELCHFRGLCFPSHMQTLWTKVLTYPGISHKCWLISEKWGSREETGSNYWISVVSVCAYVCHCCIYMCVCVCVCVWCDHFSSLSFSFSPKVTSLSLESYSSLRTDLVLCLLSPACHLSTSTFYIHKGPMQRKTTLLNAALHSTCYKLLWLPSVQLPKRAFITALKDAWQKSREKEIVNF